MVSIKELEIKLARAEAEASTWKEAFKMLNYHGVPVNEETLKKVRSRKTAAEDYEEGGKDAEMFLKSNNITDLEEQAKQMKAGGMVAQNAMFAWLANYVREKVISAIVAFIEKLIKENAVAVADWLLSQAEDKIIDGYIRLSQEDRFLLKNQLKEHPRFSELLKKIEERENKG